MFPKVLILLGALSYYVVICIMVSNYKKISVSNWTALIKDVECYLYFVQLVSMKKKTSVLWHLLLIAALDMPLVLFDSVKTLH